MRVGKIGRRPVMESSIRTLARQRRLSLAVAACVGALMAGPALATSYSESVDGEFSSLGASPTTVLLSVGSNVISGATGGDAASHPDRDYFTFTIAAGQQLAAIDVLAGTDSPTRSFFGIAAGSQTLVDPASFSAVGLLGWTLFSVADVGSNVLDDLGEASPPNFPSFPGATGFSGPLGAGAYTAWIQDSDPETARYALDFRVAPVPEPESWTLLLVGFGALGVGLRRRRESKMEPETSACTH
jgi:hypothetical protein